MTVHPYHPTPAQVETLAHLDRYTREHGYSPSISELSEMSGLTSRHAAHMRLRGLVSLGLVTYDLERARSWTVTRNGRRLLAKREAARLSDFRTAR